MKHLILLSLFFIGCKSPNIITKTEFVYKIDTIFSNSIDTIIKVDTIFLTKYTEIKPTDTIVKECDNLAILKAKNDSLYTNLVSSNYKLERIKYYLKITINNSSQTKFLKSWIRRIFNL